MPKVIVTTDDGQAVWTMDGIESWHVSGKLKAAGNVRAQNLASGIVRAVRDAEVIQAGGDPERPSEKAMRLVDEGRKRDSEEERLRSRYPGLYDDNDRHSRKAPEEGER